MNEGWSDQRLKIRVEESGYLTVYYESRKRELETRPIYECRSDERLKTESEKSTHLGTGTPKDKDEVNRRDVSVCDVVCGELSLGISSLFCRETVTHTHHKQHHARKHLVY